ncbi:MAG: hypothetical protein AB1345_12970 [Chloroflexota bacterium]
MAIIVLVAIWVVIGVLMTALADSIWKGRRPIGVSGDYIVSILAAILTGLGDWYLLPLINIDGPVKFAAAVIEPAIVALIVLWAVRFFKKGALSSSARMPTRKAPSDENSLWQKLPG